MARRLFAGATVAAALAVVGTAAAGRQPIIRSARVVRHHLVLRVSVSDVRPVLLTVATRRAVGPTGAFLRRNVRVRETMELPASAHGVLRWRSRAALRRGVWFVQVMAVETGGVTDCPPKQRRCGEHWSNVRRIVVRHPS